MISISGIDCCGKSTQIELLCEELKSKGQKCEVIWSLGGCSIASKDYKVASHFEQSGNSLQCESVNNFK